ncbi:Aste57867_20042 [Aphanomyces stellatus]|uniref:Aste57867_20042 protein n=1 Tax=Aphanomyces stellatus TaxID=120398 RepID=A0A485LE15_9STRA|nr:hypothetical protein As57867_019976 [Aphanomyces stellatus]VFT96738.1 Aste57867_20042 [Aphanomyces stellatus]
MATKAGWECFDDSDDDADVHEEQSESSQIVGRIMTEMARCYSACPKAHGVAPDLILPPTAHVTAPDDLRAMLEQRLLDAGWLLAPAAAPTDVVVDLVAFTAAPHDTYSSVAEILHDRVLPGGLVITQLPAAVSVDWASDLWSTSRALSFLDEISSPLVALKRRSGVANPLHYRLDQPTALALDVERQWIDTVTIASSASERAHGALSLESHQRAVDILRSCGVVIVRGLYDPDTVRQWGAAALSDFAQIAHALRETHDMDVFNPGEKPPRRNFVEFATREAFRCDIRHTPALTALRATHPADESTRTGAAINPRHPVIHAILQDVMQPDGGPLNPGNYGLWNFSFGGPGSRERLVSGPVGSIVTTPGCYDQKIHADIPHLFNTMDLPPHLLHVFLPACDAGGMDAGQTAFVVESHRLATCARMMANDGSGVQETIAKTIRPHVTPGDVIVFDCRVLHLGLANTTAAMGATDDGVRRPILYVNWHAPWFEDKKNWEPESLFK